MPDKWAAYLEPAEQAPPPADRWAQYAEPGQSDRVPAPSLAGPQQRELPHPQLVDQVTTNNARMAVGLHALSAMVNAMPQGQVPGVPGGVPPAPPPFLENERNFIRSGGTPSIQRANAMPQPVAGVPGGVPPGPPRAPLPAELRPFALRSAEERLAPPGAPRRRQGIAPQPTSDALTGALQAPFIGTGVGSIATGAGELQKPGALSKVRGAADIGSGRDAGSLAKRPDGFPEDAGGDDWVKRPVFVGHIAFARFSQPGIIISHGVYCHCFCCTSHPPI